MNKKKTHLRLSLSLLLILSLLSVIGGTNAEALQNKQPPADSIATDTILNSEKIPSPLPNPFKPPQDSITPAPADSAAIPTSDSLSVSVDSAGTVAEDSLTTLIADSLAPDTTVLDIFPPLPPPEPLKPDTLPPRSPSPTARVIERDDFTRFGYKDAGEAIGTVPGLYPRQSSFFAQPFYLISPGGSGRDLMVLYRGRPYNDPVTGAASFNTFAVEEIERVDIEQGWSGSGPLNSGPVLTLHSPFLYPVTSRTHIIYRQGFYGLGHADWRIAQKPTRDFRYHIGVDIGEYKGRRINSAANSSQLRIGARRRIGRFGQVDFSWMQTQIRHGRAMQNGSNSIDRNDLDLAWIKGETTDSLYTEVAGWYVRSKRGFYGGREDGYRLGGRFRIERQLISHRVSLAGDGENIGALFGTYPSRQNPKGKREVYGLTVTDRFDSRMLHTDIALRGEAGTLALHPDGRGRKILPLCGGSCSMDYGDSLGPGALASANLGWRWPGLDESYGFWSVRYPARLPERLMNLSPGLDSSLYYTGNASLEPVGGLYTGAGGRWRFNPDRGVRFMAGYRRYIKPLVPVETAPNTWTTTQDDDHAGLEVTGSGWSDLYGPFSLAAAFTLTDVAEDGVPVPEKWGWTSLRFENSYYNGQLRMRLTLNSYYWDEYKYRDITEPALIVHDGLIAARVINFEAYWGTNNIFSNKYEFQPGCPAMHRDEIWGVRWILRD